MADVDSPDTSDDGTATGSGQSAQYAWHAAYNTEFRPRFEAYCSDVVRGACKKRLPAARIQELLEETIYTVPREPEFKYLRLIHNCFCRMCDAVLNLDAPDESPALLKKLKALSGDVWEVFAKRAAALDRNGPMPGKTPLEESVWKRAVAMEEEYDDILSRGAVSLSEEVMERLASAPGGSVAVTPDEMKRRLDEIMARRKGSL